MTAVVQSVQLSSAHSADVVASPDVGDGRDLASLAVPATGTGRDESPV